MASNKKNSMKQTSYNIHFYIGIEVTSFDFQQFFPLDQIHGALVGNQQIQPGVGKKITCTQEENIFGSFQILNW